MISAVIFDRDGVLTDFDIPSAVQYFSSLLPIDLQAIEKRWHSWGMTVGFPRNLAEETQFWYGFWEQISDDLDLSSEVRTQLHQVDYTQFMKPFPDAQEALLIAREKQLKTGVLSNFTLASLTKSLTAVGLAEFVDEACAAPVIGASKPDPKAYLTITQRLGVKPEECLFFDDEIECVAGATAVGMQAYLVDRHRSGNDLAASIVQDLSALSTILNTLFITDS